MRQRNDAAQKLRKLRLTEQHLFGDGGNAITHAGLMSQGQALLSKATGA
jgi:hypothetical protein